MNNITKDQYLSLLQGDFPSSLDEGLKMDIPQDGAILLVEEDGQYYFDGIELNELSDEEIEESKEYGKIVYIEI